MLSKKRLIVGLFTALLTPSLAVAQTPPEAATALPVVTAAPTTVAEGEWQFMVAPYIWFVSVQGVMTVKGTTASVDASFGDIFDKLNIGFFGNFQAQKGPLNAFGDVIFADLGASATSGPLSIDTDMTLLIFDFGMAYEVARVRLSGYDAETPVWLSVEPLAGGRLFYVDGKIEPERLPSLSESETWVDPVVGLRLSSDITPNWNVRLRGDVGGFGVSSDLTWQALGAVGYRFGIFNEGDSNLLLGYRAIYDDYSSGSFAVDATFHGPLLGLAVTF